jgi:hypothetical protein
MRREQADIDGILTRLLAGERTTTLAAIWATVDRERAAAASGAARDELPGDELLGAFVTLLSPGGDEPPIALLEPSTEGRLAATLARNGEGPAGRYVGVEDGPVFDRLSAAAASAGVALTHVGAGPFGPSRLVVGLSPGGPHLVLVDRRAGTIGR